MADPVHAKSVRIAGQSGRMYTVDGEALPSVTTVLKQLAAPALTRWQVKQAAIAAVDTQDWRAMDGETAVEMIMAAARSTNRQAMTKGTTIHEAIDSGAADAEIHVDHRPYVQAARGVLQTLAAEGYEPYESEVTMANLYEGYAGTADYLLMRPDDDGETGMAVLDWKSTKLESTVGWRNHQMQLAALSACEMIVDDAGELLPTPEPITELIIVGVKPDGTADMRRIDDEVTIKRLQVAFNGLLRCTQLDIDLPHLSAWNHSDEGMRSI